ncbi:MAG: NAD(P)H:quinone oxidoreductase [Aliiglaciecola sp.]
MGPVLVLYYSLHGSTRLLANKIAQGIEAEGADAIIRTVPKVSDGFSEKPETIPTEGDMYVTHEDIKHCSGIALGSPTRFGNMSAAMKYFWDSTAPLWLSGELNGKPGCVFTSSSSLHGGQESTLLSMMLPMIHHGMVIVSLPYSVPQLHTTRSGGTPYGPSHVSFGNNEATLSDDESALAIAMGKRLAITAKKLG